MISPRRLLGATNLFQRTTEMDGAGAGTHSGGPRNGLSQCPINFIGADPVPVAFQAPPVGLGKAMTGDQKKLTWSYVTENDPCRWKGIERMHSHIGNDFTAQGAKIRCQCESDILRASTGDRPSRRVSVMASTNAILHAGTNCAFLRGHQCPRYTPAPDESGLQAPLMGRQYCSMAIHRRGERR